jgi:RimJ/RimL family protein N-acetyltransferase
LAEDVIIRPPTGVEELPLFAELSYVLDKELPEDFARGLRRPDWAWIAVRDRRLVARAAWWGPAEHDIPSLLDFLDVGDDRDRVEVGSRMLQTALAHLNPAGVAPPEYTRFVVPDWRLDPVICAQVEDLMQVVEAAGGQLLAERFRFQWQPGTVIPQPSWRIRFRPIADECELIELMTAVLEGTLDAHSRQDLCHMPPQAAARSHFHDELAGYDTPRDWWQVATLPNNEPIGFVIAVHNSYWPIIAYLGVLPAHRGHGYANDLLAHGTRILAQHDPPRIRASTDLGNKPMAAAFSRAGWVNFQRPITMTWLTPGRS